MANNRRRLTLRLFGQVPVPARMGVLTKSDTVTLFLFRLRDTGRRSVVTDLSVTKREQDSPVFKPEPRLTLLVFLPLRKMFVEPTKLHEGAVERVSVSGV